MKQPAVAKVLIVEKKSTRSHSTMPSCASCYSMEYRSLVLTNHSLNEHDSAGCLAGSAPNDSAILMNSLTILSFR